MSTKKIYLFEYLSPESATHIEASSTLLLWGLLCIILLMLLSSAFSMQPGGQAEYHDSFLMEEVLSSWMSYIPEQPYRPSLPSSIFALILFPQYLRSHIAEKRPDDSRLTISLLARRRYYPIVSSFFYSHLARLLRHHPGQRENLRRQMTIRGLFQFNMFQKIFLIQGGL